MSPYIELRFIIFAPIKLIGEVSIEREPRVVFTGDSGLYRAIREELTIHLTPPLHHCPIKRAVNTVVLCRIVALPKVVRGNNVVSAKGANDLASKLALWPVCVRG